MSEKRFQYNVNKNTIEQNGKFVAYMNSVDGIRIANKLNVFQKENEQLQARIKYLERKIQRERNSNTKEHEKWENEIITKNEKIKQQRDFYYARLQKIIKIANGDFE